MRGHVSARGSRIHEARPPIDADLGAVGRRKDGEYLVGDWGHGSGGRQHNHLPETDLQALMEAAPHQEPYRAQQQAELLPTPALDLLDELGEPDRSVVNWYVFEKRSLRWIAAALEEQYGTDHPYQISRIRDRAFGTLAAQLETTQDDWDLAV